MAEDVRFKHFPLNMVAVERGDNAITAHHFGVSQYPTLRLYQGKDDKEFKEMEYSKDGHDLTEEKFKEFLKNNGVDLNKKNEDESDQE